MAKKFRLKRIIIIVSAIIALAAGFGAFYFTTNSKSQAALDNILANLEKILVWYDKCSGYYNNALDAVSIYTANPSEANLKNAKQACLDALDGINSLAELSHTLDGKTIIQMGLLKIDIADFYALFNTQAFYKNDYATSISSLLFYIGCAPALDNELSHMLAQKQQLETEFRKINYTGINHLLAEVSNDKLQSFKSDFLPSLKTFSKDNLPWENDKSILELKTDALFISAENVIEEYSRYVSEEYTKLLQDKNAYKSFLIEHGFTESEALQRIKEISIFPGN